MRKKSQQCLQEFEPEQLKEKDGKAQVHWEGGGLERQITSVLVCGTHETLEVYI